MAAIISYVALMYAAVASKERNIPQPSKENYNCYLTIENRTLFAYIKKKE
jgi:hypothetical protein